MERALAHIERIIGLFPIEGADQIEAAQVLGWYVVVKKGDFKLNDLCIFFEIDSFLDGEDPRYKSFEERFTNWNGNRGMRLKTIKLRGQISQGLVLKMDDFPEVQNKIEGDDVTELLKVQKWMPAEEIHANTGGTGSKGTGTFPHFIPKTDQTRVQSLQSVIDRYLDEPFQVSIKLDGSSMTVFNVPVRSKYWTAATNLFKRPTKSWIGRLKEFFKELFSKEDQFPVTGICSRNILMKKDDESHFTQNGYDVETKLRGLGCPYAVQGELVSPTIQGNHEKVSDFQYHIFDTYNIEDQRYLTPDETLKVTETLGLKHVPVLYPSITIRQLVEGETDKTKIVAKLLELAEGPGMNQSVKREGLVFKHLNSDFSFKCISNSYLLKKEKGR